MQQIEVWLTELGLEKYVSAFAEAEIEFVDLVHITDEDLKEVGLPVGPRRRVNEAIKRLTAGGDSPHYESKNIPPQHSRSDKTLTAPSPDAERRHLTVMFVDLMNSTAMASRLDPEDVRNIITSYQNTVTEMISRYGGFVAKYMGDGVLCYFGWPQANEDDAEQAVRAGLEIIEAVRQLSEPDGVYMASRVGIATGVVIVGDLIGSGATQEAAVVGETPNLAARLQGLAQPNQIVLPKETLKLLGSVFEFVSIGDHDLKGIDGPVEVYAVLGETTRESRFDARHATALTPLVGREQEVVMIRSCWTKAIAGSGQMVLISGEAGIGKSRLTRAAIDEVARNNHTRIIYQCSPYHTDSAFYPVIQKLTLVAGILPSDGASERLDKLEDSVGTDMETIVLLAQLMGIDATERYSPLDLTPSQTRARTLDVLVQQLVRMAEITPVLAVFEDLHWVDASTLELLEVTLDAIADKKILILGTARPSFDHGFGGHPIVTRVVLNRLRRHQIETIAITLSGDKGLPAEVIDIIANRTDGVPLFVEELTKTILETSVLKEDGDKLVLDGPLDSRAIPSTLHDSLMARIDHLKPIKEVAQTAACIGREFDHQLLASISPLSADELNDALQDLIKAELIYRRGLPPDATYLFKHALVRDAAYGSLLKSKRRRLHLQIAEAIERLHPEISTNNPEIPAFHYFEAREYEAAIDFWHMAGEKAIANSANVEAIAHFNKGLESIASVEDTTGLMATELTLQSSLAVPLMFIKGWAAPEVGRLYERVRYLSDQLGADEVLFPLLRGHWNYMLTLGEHKQALNLAEEFAAHTDKRGDMLHRALSRRALGTSLFFLGRSQEAREFLFEGISTDDELTEGQRRDGIASFGDSAGVVCRLYSAWNSWFSGYPDFAARMVNDGLALSKELSFTHSIGWALCFKSVICNHGRDYSTALLVADAAIEHATEHQLVAWIAIGNMCRGRALAGLGEHGKGLDLLRHGLAKWHETGARLGDTQWMGFLASACIDARQFDEAGAVLEKAILVVESTEEQFYLAELERLKGILLRQSGNIGEAEQQFSSAIEHAKKNHSKSTELRISTNLADLWANQGKSKKATTLLAPVYGWFTEGFDALDYKDAKALLDKLARIFEVNACRYLRCMRHIVLTAKSTRPTFTSFHKNSYSNDCCLYYSTLNSL